MANSLQLEMETALLAQSAMFIAVFVVICLLRFEVSRKVTRRASLGAYLTVALVQSTSKKHRGKSLVELTPRSRL